MKTQHVITSLTLAVIGALCLAALYGCATMNERSAEKFLTAAGFQRRAPSTPKQKEIYERMQPYKLQVGTNNGKTFYAYKDEKQGVIYFGNEQQYQEYQRLIAQGLSNAEQLNENEQMDAIGWGFDL